MNANVFKVRVSSRNDVEVGNGLVDDDTLLAVAQTVSLEARQGMTGKARGNEDAHQDR